MMQSAKFQFVIKNIQIVSHSVTTVTLMCSENALIIKVTFTA